MADINKEIQSILELNAQAKSIQANARSVSAQANEKMKTLRERIKQGETTGDRIRDFVIACYGFLNEEIEAVYRDLEARISQHVGEFVLVIVKEERFHGCTGFGYRPRDEDYFLDEHLFLGILKAGALVLNPADGNCEFPTGNHIRHLDIQRENMDLVDGNLTSYGFYQLGLSLNRPLNRRNPMARFQREPDLELEVRVGDTEVREWLEKWHGKKYLVALQKAAQLLGRPIPESPELAAELQRRREGVAKKLVDLVQKHNLLKQKIAPHGELMEVEREIKKQLKLALELGMADAQLLSIQQLCQEYEVEAS